VDNVLIGMTLDDDYYSVYTEAKFIFQRAAMNLREWNSNCLEFLNCLPEGERSSSTVNKVLSVLWDQFGDKMSIPGFDRMEICVTTTKCDALHSMAKVFGPLGLLVPLTLVGKLFLQKLWSVDVTWDQPLSQELINKWNDIVKSLSDASTLKIDRFIASSGDFNQLIIFCDASTKAYATVVYLRTWKNDDYCNGLLFCKAHLVPVGRGRKKAKFKHLTVPRLELLAVLIGVRVSNFPIKELRINICRRILWTDSQCILHWLKAKKPLSLFVEN